VDDRKPADDPQQPLTAGGWLKQNATSLVVVAAVLVAVFRYLHPFDVLLAVAGLSFIIFVHELGHFLAAKWCDVHVKTFSIGFGPAVPGCQFKYGETTYKLALIPLGGFVAMVGEGDTEGDVVDAEDDPRAAREEARRDPRSFANKPVGQRMLIISAGVIMNILLGAVFFAVAYSHGVEEVPTVVSAVEPGGAAWRAGIVPGSEITQVNGRQNPFYDDLRVAVTSTGKGETVDLDVKPPQGPAYRLVVEPLVQEGALYPTLGVVAPKRLAVPKATRDSGDAARPGSPAAAAGFRPGDVLVAMTDPADPSKLTPFVDSTAGKPGEYFDYAARLDALAGKPVAVRVSRDGGTTELTVPPAFRKSLGLRMQMGAVVAVRAGSPAEAAGLRARRVEKDTVLEPGDEIVAVEFPEAGGGTTRYTADATELSAGGASQPLDPVRLPWQAAAWAARRPEGKAVKLTVLREVDAAAHTRQRADLTLAWDDAHRGDFGPLQNPGTPLTVGGLGLAYHVRAVVGAVTPGSPAAAAGLQPNDRVKQVRFYYQDGDAEKQAGWDDVPAHQWAYVDHKLQLMPPHRLDAKVERGGQTVEVTLAAADDPTWPVAERGLYLEDDRRTLKADGLVDALRLGAYRAVRSGKMIYQQLYAMVFGRISVKLMSGPITLARASYLIAGQDVWHLLIWLALISINLAVVNFLPIPVLDGGHMVFLLYEAVRGKPAPVAVQAVMTYAGLAVVGCLMLFVIGLDVWRLVFA
jgi:regulator of sigma E protease